MSKIEFPPDSFLPDERGVGLNPLSSVRSDAAGLKKRYPANAAILKYGGKVRPVQSERRIDSQTVCQIAVARLLSSLTMTRSNLDALLERGDIQSSTFKFSRISIGWPRREESLKPLPMAVVLPDGDTTLAMPNLEAQFLEGTENAYAPGTVLRQTSQATQLLSVHVLSAHKEERRAIRSEFETALLAEPDDDQVGRKQIVEEYFSRTVSVDLLSMRDMDGESTSRPNEFELVANFRARVAVVHLTTTPGRIRDASHLIAAGNAIISGK